MAERNRILALVDRLRAASITRRLAETAAHAVSYDIDVVIYDKSGEVPFYNEDHAQMCPDALTEESQANWALTQPISARR